MSDYRDRLVLFEGLKSITQKSCNCSVISRTSQFAVNEENFQPAICNSKYKIHKVLIESRIRFPDLKSLWQDYDRNSFWSDHARPNWLLIGILCNPKKSEFFLCNVSHLRSDNARPERLLIRSWCDRIFRAILWNPNFYTIWARSIMFKPSSTLCPMIDHFKSYSISQNFKCRQFCFWVNKIMVRNCTQIELVS